MTSVTILRVLWRNRVMVCVAGLAALAAGWMIAFGASFPPKPRAYTLGVATVSVLVDTPKSQVVEIDPKGSDTLGARANVLANLMVDGDIKNAIARRIGIGADKLSANVDAADKSGPTQPLTRRSLSYSTSVAVTSDMAELPIIRVSTQAPTLKQAITLANATVAGVGEYLDSKAVDETIANDRRLRVRALGTAQGHEAARGPGRMMALGVAIFAFLAGCTVIVAVSALRSGWRAAVAAEEDVDLDYAAIRLIEADDDLAEDEATVHPVAWKPSRRAGGGRGPESVDGEGTVEDGADDEPFDQEDSPEDEHEPRLRAWP
jgi:hypothetical protein